MFRKYDRVKCEFDGRTVHGVVIKGGSNKIIVREYNSNLQITGHPDCFKMTNKPLPIDKHHQSDKMDKYSIKSYKSMMGKNGIAYSCKIYVNGNLHIGYMENNGNGGFSSAYHVDNRYGEFQQFQKDVHDWCELYYGNVFDPAEIWNAWKIEDAPYGQTATHCGNIFQQRFNEIADD